MLKGIQNSEEELIIMFYQFVPSKIFFFSAIINSVRISHLHGYLFKIVLYTPAVVLLFYLILTSSLYPFVWMQAG